MSKKLNFLVIVDMQNDFIDKALGSEAAQAIVPNVVNKIKTDGDNIDYIITTQDYHNDHYSETQEGKKLPVDHCIAGTLGVQLNEEVQKAIIGWCQKPKKDFTSWINVTKPAFGSLDLPTDIIRLMEANNVHHADITICGLCTNMCVIACTFCVQGGLFNNLNYNADITVDAACCAGTSDVMHNAALDVMESCLINVINR